MITFLKRLGVYIIIVGSSIIVTGLMRAYGFTVTQWDCVASICLWWLISKDDAE